MVDTIPPGLRNYSDDAKRFSDVITLHIVAGMSGYWAAIRLSDGGSDGVAYPSKATAIRHQLHEDQCCYVCIPPDSMSPRSAERFLKIHRQLRDNGYKFSDPDLSPVLQQRSH